MNLNNQAESKQTKKVQKAVILTQSQKETLMRWGTLTDKERKRIENAIKRFNEE